MKSKRSVACRSYKIQEAEVVRRCALPALESPLERAVDGLRQLRRGVAYSWSQTEHRVNRLVTKIRYGLENTVGKHISQIMPPPTTQHVFATMSRKWAPMAAQNSLSLHQEEIKRRVSHIPVYLVAKQNGKLIYVKPEQNEQVKKPIGLLFLAASGARQLLAKVREDVPEFASDMHVISLDLGSLYEMFTNKKFHNLQHVMFRFVPEPQQVQHAMQIMKQNGRRAKNFTGVPIFHVDGLNTGEERLRPMFLDKEDLDSAIDSATRRKLARDRYALREEVDVLKAEANEARLLAKQSDGREAEKWVSLAAKAEAKSRRVSKKIQELPDSLSSLVRVEVRCLEDVLSEMEHDRTGSFGNSFLIPSGLAKGQMVEAPFANYGDRRIIELQNKA